MLNLYKKRGETPLERLNRLRLEHPEYKDKVLSYAGRLDPMAEGVLLVMEGDENNERNKFLNFDKTYEVEILFGITTDTHDALGVVGAVHCEKLPSEDEVVKEINSYLGKFIQKYPAYSSRTVGGVPLWESSRKGEVVEVPQREVTIYKIDFEGSIKISKKDLLKRATDEVSGVNGDFRQKEIIESWKSLLSKSNCNEFTIIKITLDVSSGFYVRVFADMLGRRFGVGAIALSIKRIKAGNFSILNAAV